MYEEKSSNNSDGMDLNISISILKDGYARIL